jgi:redox-sensitive bicupin YhaK (pirin superfamily)
MEIITFVRQGTVAHKDSYGNIGQTKAGEVQVMSAGTGIKHEEYNAGNEPIEAYQIWIIPNKMNVEPIYNQMSFPVKNVKDSLPLLVSGDKNDNVLFINQDARIYGGNINKSDSIKQNIKYQGYVLCSKGSFVINDKFILNKGDAATVVDIKTISIQAKTDAEIVIIDVPSLI